MLRVIPSPRSPDAVGAGAFGASALVATNMLDTDVGLAAISGRSRATIPLDYHEA